MTDFSIFLMLVGIVVLLILIPRSYYYIRRHQNYLGRNQLKRLKKDNDFDVAHIVYGPNHAFFLAIDYDLGKVAYIEDDNHLLLNFDEIINVNILTYEEIASLGSKQAFNQRAYIGKNLLVEGDDISIEVKEKKLEEWKPYILVHLELSLAHLPDVYINCFNSKAHTVSWDAIKETDFEDGMEMAENIKALFVYIIEVSAHKSNKKS